jgi:hypothetical protein
VEVVPEHASWIIVHSHSRSNDCVAVVNQWYTRLSKRCLQPSDVVEASESPICFLGRKTMICGYSSGMLKKILLIRPSSLKIQLMSASNDMKVIERTMHGVNGGIMRVGHQERELGTDMPVRLLFPGFCRVEVHGNLIPIIVSLRE